MGSRGMSFWHTLALHNPAAEEGRRELVVARGDGPAVATEEKPGVEEAHLVAGAAEEKPGVEEAHLVAGAEEEDPAVPGVHWYPDEEHCDFV
jgi:hypothetical protein